MSDKASAMSANPTTPVHMQTLSFGSHASNYMSSTANQSAPPNPGTNGAGDNMVADFPVSDPKQTNFSTKELTAMAIGCSRSSLRADMNFFICMLRRFPLAAYVLEMNAQKFETITYLIL